MPSGYINPSMRTPGSLVIGGRRDRTLSGGSLSEAFPAAPLLSCLPYGLGLGHVELSAAPGR